MDGGDTKYVWSATEKAKGEDKFGAFFHWQKTNFKQMQDGLTMWCTNEKEALELAHSKNMSAT